MPASLELRLRIETSCFATERNRLQRELTFGASNEVRFQLDDTAAIYLSSTERRYVVLKDASNKGSEDLE